MTNYLLTNKCRQCGASVGSRVHACPLCGISRPIYETLTPLEKEYLTSPPAVPGKFYYMPNRIKPHKNLLYNLTEQTKYYLASPSMSQNLWGAIFMGLICGYFAFLSIGFPFTFILFWPALVYVIYDLINIFRAVTISLLISRLQLKGGASPYSVHFKLEEQLTQMLLGLQMILNTFFEKSWVPADERKKSAAASFYQAIKTLTTQIVKYARISLETTAIIWRNNVYAIVAEQNQSMQDKIILITNKIREGEALILRYCWFLHLDSIQASIEDYVSNPGELRQEDFRRNMIEGNQLSSYGPLSEPYKGDFHGVPYELAFKMRYYWHEQLMPAPLPSSEIIKKYPETKDFFESIEQVRLLKESLEQQMILDCASNALGDIMTSNKTTLEAADIKRNELYSQLLDIPNFQSSNNELQNQIDRLNAQLKL